MKIISFTVLGLLLGTSIANNTNKGFLKNSGKPQLYSTSKFAENQDKTDAPVIGIITQTLEKEMLPLPQFEGYKSYIMKSYVDSLEAAGARVVPLIVGESFNVTTDKLLKLNGVLMPGGDGDYLEFGRQIYNTVKQLNDNGTYYPLWGTCMGYENMASYVSDNGWNVFDVYDYDTGSMALEFVKDPRQTKMFKDLGDKAFLFETYNTTYNSHHWGMNPDRFNNDSGLSQIYHPTAISYMPDGRPIVAAIESDNYPFFGTQFHPEKTTRIFGEDLGIDHSWLSIGLNKHFSEFFVQQTRQNNNTYGTYSQTQKEIVENYDLIVTDEWFDTVYVFK